jgi:universal stress protein A
MIKSFVVISASFSGDITKSDYDQFTPQVEAIVKASGSIRMLMDMTGLKGEKSEAWKSDWNFGKEFQDKIEKLAMVGDKAWEAPLAKAFGPKYAQQAKYFDADSISSAWDWLRE